MSISLAANSLYSQMLMVSPLRARRANHPRFTRNTAYNEIGFAVPRKREKKFNESRGLRNNDRGFSGFVAGLRTHDEHALLLSSSSLSHPQLLSFAAVLNSYRPPPDLAASVPACAVRNDHLMAWNRPHHPFDRCAAPIEARQGRCAMGEMRVIRE